MLLGASSAATPDGFAKFLPRAYGHAEKITKAFKGVDEAAPENLAWKWLSMTLSQATAQFLVVLRRQTKLVGTELDGAVAAFIDDAMDLPDTAHFEAATFLHTATHPAFEPARGALQPLIQAVTTWTQFDMVRLQADFDRCLHAASAHVCAANHEEFAPLVATVAGPAGEAARAG